MRTFLRSMPAACLMVDTRSVDPVRIARLNGENKVALIAPQLLNQIAQRRDGIRRFDLSA